MRSTPPSQSQHPSVTLLCRFVDTRQGKRRIIGFVLPRPDEHFYNNSVFSTSTVVQNQPQGLQGIDLSAI